MNAGTLANLTECLQDWLDRESENDEGLEHVPEDTAGFMAAAAADVLDYARLKADLDRCDRGDHVGPIYRSGSGARYCNRCGDFLEEVPGEEAERRDPDQI